MVHLSLCSNKGTWTSEEWNWMLALWLWLHANKLKQSSYWTTPPTTTLDSVQHQSSILTALKWAHIWLGWCFAFIQKEVLLLSDSNKDKTCPGDPLLILLISGWLDPHQYQGAAVALHSCTSQQKAVWTRQQLTRLKESEHSTKLHSNVSHFFYFANKRHSASTRSQESWHKFNINV